MSVETPVSVFSPAWILLLIAALGFLLVVVAGIRRPALAIPAFGLAFIGLYVLIGVRHVRHGSPATVATVVTQESFGRLAPERPLPPPQIQLPEDVAAAEAIPVEATGSLEAGLGAAARAGTPAASIQAESTAAPIRVEAEPQPRPDWVGGSDHKGKDGAYQMVIRTDAYARLPDCDEALGQAAREATEAYMRRMYGLPSHARSPLELEPAYILEHIVQQEWTEHRPLLVNGVEHPMYVKHALLEFDSEVRKHIERQYAQQVRARRLGYTASGAGLLLGVLATFFGYLKLDTLSRGYYSGRLRFAAAAMILTQAVVAALMVRGLAGV